MPVDRNPGVKIEELNGGHPITGVPTSVAAFVGYTTSGPTNRLVDGHLFSFVDFERLFGGLAVDSPLSYAVYHFFQNGGREAYVNRVVSGTNAPPGATELLGSEAAKTGIYALDTVDLFNLLVLPDPATDREVLAAAVAYCTRRRAFLLLGPPESVSTAAQAQNWMQALPSALQSRNAAAYFPRFLAPDPLQKGRVRAFPGAGALAGLYARTDLQHGVWKAPAGTSGTLLGTTGLAVTLVEQEIGTLNALGLNCLRTLPGNGTVAWGVRTLPGADTLADEYKYIPVRRLALYIEESLYRGTQWVVFEPNAEPLWAQVRLGVDAFMSSLWRQGAFQGQTPAEAYFVKCDRTTMTQDDLNKGILTVLVGFAPLKPAEFLIIKIQQQTART
jgi:phage tail sheath protein FI